MDIVDKSLATLYTEFLAPHREWLHSVGIRRVTFVRRVHLPTGWLLLIAEAGWCQRVGTHVVIAMLLSCIVVAGFSQVTPNQRQEALTRQLQDGGKGSALPIATPVPSSRDLLAPVTPAATASSLPASLKEKLSIACENWFRSCLRGWT